MKAQLRIGFLTPEYVMADRRDGGLANYLHTISWELVQRNHQVTVFVLSDRDEYSKDGEIQIVEVKRANKLTFPRWLNDKLERFLPLIEATRAARRIENAVWRHHQRAPFDLLHTSSYSAPGFTLRRNGKIPVVCRISCYTPMLRAAYGRQRKFGDYLADWLEIRQVLDSDASFSPSQFISNIYERLEGFKPAVLRSPTDGRTVPIDDSVFREKLTGFPYFLFVGTLSKIKGVDLLADAIPQFLKIHPEIHFVFIGRDDGIPGYKNAMDYVALKSSEFQQNIHYIGRQPKSRLYPIISHSLAVLIPSRIDNYPNVCLEAHAMNVPVVGTDNSSLEEMIEDNQTGFLIRNSDSSALLAGLQKVAELSDDERNRLKENIKNHIRSIEMEDRIEQLVALYRNTIQKYSGQA
jgi:glycogen synthase